MIFILIYTFLQGEEFCLSIFQQILPNSLFSQFQAVNYYQIMRLINVREVGILIH